MVKLLHRRRHMVKLLQSVGFKTTIKLFSPYPKDNPWGPFRPEHPNFLKDIFKKYNYIMARKPILSQLKPILSQLNMNSRYDKLWFRKGDIIQYKELKIRFFGTSWLDYIGGGASKLPGFVVTHSNGSEWKIYFRVEALSLVKMLKRTHVNDRIFLNYHIQYVENNTNKKECLKIRLFKKGEKITPKIIGGRGIELKKGEKRGKRGISFEYDIFIKSHDDFSKPSKEDEINSLILVISERNTSKPKILKEITFGHRKGLTGVSLNALFKMHKFKEFLIIWNYNKERVEKGIFDFRTLQFNKFDMKFEDMVKTQMPAFKMWIESRLNNTYSSYQKHSIKYIHSYESITSFIKSKIVRFFPKSIQQNSRNSRKKETPIIILTIPHAKCNENHQVYEHTCDFSAPKAARRLQESFTKLGIQSIQHSSTINRTICDMNRWSCINTPYRRKLRNIVKQQQSKFNHDVFVLDLHSFPNKLFPQDELFILDSQFTGRERSSRPTTYSLNFKQYLKREKGISISIHRAKANKNSIMEEMTRKLGIKSFLLEFNERLENNSTRFTYIINAITQWFQMKL